MSRISRGTPATDAYLDLKNRAQREKRLTQELLQLYVLEAFLSRLAASDLRDRFVLKGGVLLAAFAERRPTRDVDLAGLNLANDAVTVLELVRSIVETSPPLEDGVVFLPDTAKSEVIREEDAYSGVRVSMGARLASASLPFHVDVNVGAATQITCPSLSPTSSMPSLRSPIPFSLARLLECDGKPGRPNGERMRRLVEADAEATMTWLSNQSEGDSVTGYAPQSWAAETRSTEAGGNRPRSAQRSQVQILPPLQRLGPGDSDLRA